MVKMGSIDWELVSNCGLSSANYESEISVTTSSQINVKSEFKIFKIFPKKMVLKCVHSIENCCQIVDYLPSITNPKSPSWQLVEEASKMSSQLKKQKTKNG